jgi:hypothetical protein
MVKAKSTTDQYWKKKEKRGKKDHIEALKSIESKKQKKIKNEEVMIIILDCHGSWKHILELQS